MVERQRPPITELAIKALRISHSLNRVKSFLEQPAGNDPWPNRFNLDGTLTQESFLEQAVRAGQRVSAIKGHLRENALPTLERMTLEIKHQIRIAQAEELVKEIANFVTEGHLPPEALVKAEEELNNIKKSKPKELTPSVEHNGAMPKPQTAIEPPAPTHPPTIAEEQDEIHPKDGSEHHDPSSSQTVFPEPPIPTTINPLPPLGQAFQPEQLPETNGQNEKWWNDNMLDKEYYIIEDFILLYRRLEDRKRPVEKNERITMNRRVKKICEKDKSIKPRYLPNERHRLFYSKEDAKKIITALLTNKAPITRGKKTRPINRADSPRTHAPEQTIDKAQDAPKTDISPDNSNEMGHALNLRIEAMWTRLEQDEQKRALDSLGRLKQQIILKATRIVLSHLNTDPPVGLLEKNLSTFLTYQLDSPIILSQKVSIQERDMFIPFLVKRFYIENLGTFFIDSFAKKLEELWSQDPRSDVAERDKQIIQICQKLKAKRFNIQTIVEMVCNHFHIAIPEKYKPKTALRQSTSSPERKSPEAPVHSG